MQWYAGATFMHPNPWFYKYYWWVFWKESPVDGLAFLSKEYRLSTAAAMQLLASLRERKEPCLIYNSRHPRMDKANVPFPLNPESERWKDTEWAPAYDDDPGSRLERIQVTEMVGETDRDLLDIALPIIPWLTPPN